MSDQAVDINGNGSITGTAIAAMGLVVQSEIIALLALH